MAHTSRPWYCAQKCCHKAYAKGRRVTRQTGPETLAYPNSPRSNSAKPSPGRRMTRRPGTISPPAPGRWRWDALPPTLVMTCTTSDDPTAIGKNEK